ncbi:MAG: flagellar export chaperone FliS [Acidimicrobiia bacterium]|nr:flagellar export chaperone FliS [Acidimicrobiia bacterium]MDH4309194.1 flagellar export chaperone FliS [Acidimicrobiia bacterium]MDH5292976.1 flagellar export chaperone FliS [Acidimicrobiia bacterium]
MNAALETYRQSSIDTASPGRLIVMLYDGVIASIDKVEAALSTQRPDLATAHSELTRAQAIISELLQTLDMSVGPVAISLASLYEFCHRQLVQANVEKSIEPTRAVRDIFADLRDAWATISGGVDPL